MLSYQPNDVRTLLTDLGVGQMNINIMVSSMFTQPATTEPMAPQIRLMVGYIQDNLNAMGVSPKLARTGMIDERTAYYLTQVAGMDFLHLSWFDVVKAVVQARRAGKKLAPPPSTAVTVRPSGVGLFDLPDVPGGTLTYVAGGFALWYLLTKKKRKA